MMPRRDGPPSEDRVASAGTAPEIRPEASEAKPRPDERLRIVVTGASRGLGLEFARQWLAAGQRVFALARDPKGSEGLAALSREHPEALLSLTCDVTDAASIRQAARAVGERVDGLEIVLNNAGVGGWRGGIGQLDLDEVREVFETNTLGPLRVSREFLPLLRRGREPRRLVHITSLMGSIGDNRSGGSYAYRISKAALNMVSVNLAHELGDDEIISVVLHPGWVRTDMGGRGASLAVDEAVGALIDTIDDLTAEHSGGFYDRLGEPLPW
jgi:NAD(P)-dependent dehydrogenase (short-subunit alcohol dehydrogenase family)